MTHAAPAARRRRVDRVLPGGLRARLVIAFTIVVAIALALVLLALPRVLDAYFIQQEERNLQTRARIMADLVVRSLLAAERAGPLARPLLQGVPLAAGPAITDALGTADAGFVKERTPVVAQANVEVQIAPDYARPDQVVYQLDVMVGDEVAAPGQQRDPLTESWTFPIPDTWWSQNDATAPTRAVTVRLSDPYTYRAQTLQTVVGLMVAAAAVALFVALIASVLIADRLTNPVRRLTAATRALAEGDLDSRVSGLNTSAPELAELGAAFDTMAERLQASIAVVRGDRDRSRDFLADVSHELRTPIAALRTFNELLRDGAAEDPATREEFLESSRQQIERLDWLATNLLELSKLDSGLVALDLRPDDLRAVVENAVQQAEPVAERRNVSLRTYLPPRPLRQRHDPPRVGQVLGNLIGNAIKFTLPGGTVSVSLRPTDDGAEIRVSDTGIGIAPDELPHVFDRFYRGSRASEERSAGSGLGLSIVRSIVEMHHGSVSMESAPGAGTTVSVVLPRTISGR